MKAAVHRTSRGLVIEEVPVPEIDDTQVLIKVANTGFCGSDHSMVESEATPDGIILGHEVSGTVAEIGSKVDDIEMGTRVIIRPTYCGTCPGCLTGRTQMCSNNRRSIGIGDLSGGFAEYVKVYPQMLIPIPSNVDSQNAALAEAYAVALHAIRVNGSQKGSVLVIGAGTIGLALVKLLKLEGFYPVVVSEPVAAKQALAIQFGADVVVDPLTENLGLRCFEISEGRGFRSVFECSGLPSQLTVAMNLAGPAGKVCLVSVLHQDIAINPTTLMFKEVQLTGSYGNTHEENIQCLEWMAEGKLDAKPLISDLISLDQLPEVYKERIHTGKTIKVMLKIGDEF